jgi:molybdopterin-guanine dinucleotide biosynthesis protein A
MGADKAFLQLAGKSLLEHALHLAREAADNVSVVGPAEKFAKYARVVPDIYENQGPLAGIHSALNWSRSDLNLIIAVDLPFVTAGFLKYLVSRARACSAVVTVPATSAGLQPLCAVYRKVFSQVASRALQQGRNKIDALFKDVSLRLISEEDLKTNGFDSAIFRNLNTPADWETAKREFASQLP